MPSPPSLILGGATLQARVLTRPVLVADIMRATLAQVTDAARVDLRQVDAAAVLGTVVADLTHLVTELVQNAIDFSPPDVRVTVIGRFSSFGRYELRVVDQGIGMTSQELADANARITPTAPPHRTDTHRLGLHVVGRLAARLGVEVTLRPSIDTGVTAEIGLPASMIIDAEPTDVQPDEWTPSRGSGRIEVVDVVDRRTESDEA